MTCSAERLADRSGVLLAACAEPVTPPTPEPPPGPEVRRVYRRCPSSSPVSGTAFSPGGETICSDGSPYSYYVYPGTVNKVVDRLRGRRRVLGRCDVRQVTGGPYQPNIASSQKCHLPRKHAFRTCTTKPTRTILSATGITFL